MRSTALCLLAITLAVAALPQSPQNPSPSPYNALYIAALNGEVYAYDADNLTTPTKLWYRDETNVAGMQGLKHNCDVTVNGQLVSGSSVTSPQPYLDFAGVISTPVIEINGQANATALYVVNLCKKTSDNSEHWWLTALGISTGFTLGSTEIAYSAAQVAANPYGPQQPFFAADQLQRPSLLITAGSVSETTYRSLIAGFGTSTNETTVGYQGWLFAYDATNTANIVAQSNSLPYITECYYPPDPGNLPACTTQPNPSTPSAVIPNPCGNGGGVWMSNRGAAANTSNQVFSATGNGGFNYCPACTHHCAGRPPGTPNIQDFTNFGEAVLRVSLENVWTTTSGQPPFWPDDYFVPYNIPSGVSNPNNYTSYFQLLNANDWDMGVSGVVLFDDNYYVESSGQTQSGTSMAITSSKRGDGYAMLQSGLGQYGSPDQVVAEFGVAASNANCLVGAACDETRTLAYWNPNGSAGDGFLVAWPWHEPPSSFQWVQSLPGSQYTFRRVSTANNPFAGLGTGISTGYPGGTLSVTVNPAESPAAAVVWAAAFPYGTTDPYNGAACKHLNGQNCPGFLLAYSLQTSPTAGVLSANQIWPAALPTMPDFEPAPYAIPTAVNGKVYAPAYGLSDGAGGYTCQRRAGLRVLTGTLKEVRLP
jgi:hypothetical protein